MNTLLAGSLSGILCEHMCATFLLCLTSQHLSVPWSLQEAEITPVSSTIGSTYTPSKSNPFASHPSSPHPLLTQDPQENPHFSFPKSQSVLCGSLSDPATEALQVWLLATDAQCPQYLLVKPTLMKCHNSEGFNSSIYFLPGWRLESRV